MMPILLYIVIFLCIVTIGIMGAKPHQKKRDPSPIVEKDHRWHSPKGEYTKPHIDRVDLKQVKHPEPEPGYVVLNGIKRKIEDCRYL